MKSTKLKIPPLSGVLVFYLAALGGTAMVLSGPQEALQGLIAIQIHPARLINDFFLIGGIGGTLLNGALVGFTGLALIWFTGIPLSGPTFAAVLTMTGFGFFGKTPLNILPIIIGVALSARLVNKTMRDYLIIALFGTALGPLVSTLAWELGAHWALSLPLGLTGGIITGFFLPPLAFAMLHLHQGYNLYNMGLTCGFFGLFASAVITGFGHRYQGALLWYDQFSWPLVLMIPLLSLLLLGTGIAGKKGFMKDLKEIQKLPGRLPSDFADLVSSQGALINAGLVGIAGFLYVLLVGGDFNGPVLGGLLTIIGFGAFGTHLRNSWSVVAGVAAATLLTGNALNAPGPILAALFSTTLGPIAGEFGYKAGFLAGFIHLLMVLNTGSWHGGMNLYNNGFAGGLTAAFLVAVIQWYKTNKEEF